MSELPPRVQSKIMTLKDAEHQAHAILTSTQRTISEASRAYDINPHGDKADALRQEIERLKLLQPANQARHRALADLNAKVARYLELLPAHVTLDDAKPIKLKPKPNETHLQAVRRLRSQIDNLVSERGRVDRASPTTKEMKAAARRYVQSLAERYPARLIIEHGKFELEFGRGVIGERAPTPLEVLSWIDPALVQHRFYEMIDATRPKPSLQMDAADRKQRLDEIKAELFELERLECTHIDAAREEGTLIEHRPNVDIRALLGLTVRKMASAAA
ncbi:hypothetical protein [Bradyrhizobium cenepequi]|uniref:hypothetical protein n=1 Tax=Bradyrhizobium cenepequi TaxID=2821403 RepID=UPI001CE28B14|nr:hypothetical protein [Bradyrhizobium cenepequi]MCA6106106.1 hypothetical protein [Bradyrhizobium cenepequi]